MNGHFEFFTVNRGLYYRCTELPVPHAFGTADGEFDTSRLVMMHQVHGTDIYIASSEDHGLKIEDHDAVITIDPAAVIATRTADCVPILMADAKHGICAAVHAGWRGTVAGIAPKTFKVLIDMGASPEDTYIAVGACARFDSYEVGEDLRQTAEEALGAEFCSEFIREKDGSLHADIPGIDIRLLTEAGAKPENIFDCGLDTISDVRFRSYRREGKREPMLNVISLGGEIPYSAKTN